MVDNQTASCALLTPVISVLFIEGSSNPVNNSDEINKRPL
ncbi:hypothetical protein SAMN05421760_10175 [Neptunomonas antarctica]|uniref:Uncharacterized protein n=1 Tax=Neptunomonas antarctica TaxID=619304 RepID=A0A1N7ISS1_9GAMM|nr:hypothetical protein SAMN05421760_10175 [Neptunomonas antarctica]